jgi:hypothetical protein
MFASSIAVVAVAATAGTVLTAVHAIAQSRADRTITVTVDRVRALDAADLFSKADFFARVTIKGVAVDSPPVKGKLGQQLNLRAIVAPNSRAAAAVYPADYWFALMTVPPKSDFPGTGPQGNGIPPRYKNQTHYIAGIKSCEACHQMGSKATRELPPSLTPFASSVAAWDRRVQSGQMGAQMSGGATGLGRDRARAHVQRQ